MTSTAADADHLLEIVGITPVEESVYLALVSSPGATTQELSARLRLAPAPLGRALRRLETEGLVGCVSRRPSRFLPTPPDVALETLALRRQEDLERVRLLGRQLAIRLRANQHAGSVSDLVQVIEGQSAIEAHRQLQSTAARELMITDRPPYAREPRDCREEETVALRRGLRVRCIYHQPSLSQPKYLAQMEADIASGEEARVLPVVPIKVTIVDRKAALMPLHVEQPTIACVLVKESALLESIIGFFESLWDSAVPLHEQRRGVTVDSKANGHIRLLRLLAAGLKDEAIARHLDVSTRTVVRRVDRLMDELGASTRFQAGLQAAKRGLL
jgi:sugar-specific transcriptional regulator TrmB/DNA-binding CsgD family transcriptional regulator